MELIQGRKICLFTVMVGGVIEFGLATEEIIIYMGSYRPNIQTILNMGHINLNMKLNRLLTIKLL
jgi:hypothetical protein